MWLYRLLVVIFAFLDGIHLKPLKEKGEFHTTTELRESIEDAVISNSSDTTSGFDWVDTDTITNLNFSDPAVMPLHSHSNMTRREKVRMIQGLKMKQIMDLQADPCEDFYRYACGNWDLHNQIPPDSISYDTFEKLRETLNQVLRNLLEETSEDQFAEKSAILKAKNLYESCTNSDKLEELKERPLLLLLEDLGGWPILSSESSVVKIGWVELMARLRLYNNDLLVSMWVGADGKNSESHIIQLDQGDLGLPSRSYYLREENNTKIIDAYSNYIRKTALALGGQPDVVGKDVASLIEFETELAKILIPSEERRNYSVMYQRITVGELSRFTNPIPWKRYLSLVLKREISEDEEVVTHATEYFLQLGFLLNNTEERTLSNYLLWRFVRHRLSNLNERFQDLKQELHAILYGRDQKPERWKYCVSYVNANMGMAVGSLFVKHFFSEESKNDTTRLIYEMQDVFTYLLDSVDWLDFETKDQAKDKLLKMDLKVGYPDYILEDDLLNAEYDEIKIDKEAYFENVLRMLEFTVQEELTKLNKTVNRYQWGTTPAVVNAYYSRSRNQIMLPAGILQPPFYHPFFPKAVNYGGIGVVIGHEITHGFDDLGRQFDSNGNLRPWWPNESIANFEIKTQCIVDQYNNYTDQVGDKQIPVNGINTQGENIADNGGIRQAFKAYERWLDNSSLSVVVDETLPFVNLTAKQLFFLSFGQIWCGTIRPEAALSKAQTAVHSPSRFRVIGSLSNTEEFARTYECPKGTAMNPLDQCVVW